jgi:hypothetical protein
MVINARRKQGWEDYVGFPIESQLSFMSLISDNPARISGAAAGKIDDCTPGFATGITRPQQFVPAGCTLARQHPASQPLVPSQSAFIGVHRRPKTRSHQISTIEP